MKTIAFLGPVLLAATAASAHELPAGLAHPHPHADPTALAVAGTAAILAVAAALALRKR